MNFNSGIVMFNHGAFGGATVRYTNLFLQLNKLYPDNFYYFLDYHFFRQLKNIYPYLPFDNIRIIDFKKNVHNQVNHSYGDKPIFYQGVKPDPEETDRTTSLPRKIYCFYTNKLKEHILYKKIEKYRKELDIRVFIGVFSGVLPLVFYLKKQPRKVAVIFSDMDSWFSDIPSDVKRL